MTEDLVSKYTLYVRASRTLSLRLHWARLLVKAHVDHGDFTHVQQIGPELMEAMAVAIAKGVDAVS